jgi:hypothetical protein
MLPAVPDEGRRRDDHPDRDPENPMNAQPLGTPAIPTRCASPIERMPTSSRTTPRRLAAVLVAGSLLALAACTGTATSGAGSTATPSTAPVASDAAAPSGAPPAPPGGGGGSAGSTDVTGTGAYTLSGGSVTKTATAISAADTDESGVLVTDRGTLTLTDVTVTTTGDSSSNDSSSFYGLNAGVLAKASSTITMTGGAITTSGSGANGAFATGDGSTVDLSGVTIRATGGGAHGVMATQGATATLTNVTVDTTGANAAPIATDRGGGTIAVTGGTFTSSGQDSPALYSTGKLVVSGATLSSTGAEAAVIEGSNSITLTDSTLTTSKADKWGVLIYQSMSGDAQGANGIFTMAGGKLASTASTGPLFYVTNSTATITLTGVDVTVRSGTLLRAAGGDWGTSGSNGGHATLIADGQRLTGDVVAESGSSAALTLQNGSSLTGAITNGELTLDAMSSWTLTADSTLTTLSDATAISGATITNIIGNGHTVTYDATLAANSALGGRTYTLAGGGTLSPA